MKRTFPSLVMMVESRPISECALTIYRPVSLRVILDILTTPMGYPNLNHKWCAHGTPGIYLLKTANGTMLAADCQETIKKPNPRTVGTITKLHLIDDGYVQDPRLFESPHTGLRLNLVELQRPQEVSYEHLKWINSVLIMLRIPAVEATRRQSLPSSNLAYQARCLHRRWDVDIELDLYLGKAEAETFVHRVRTAAGIAEANPRAHVRRWLSSVS